MQTQSKHDGAPKYLWQEEIRTVQPMGKLPLSLPSIDQPLSIAQASLSKKSCAASDKSESKKNDDATDKSNSEKDKIKEFSNCDGKYKNSNDTNDKVNLDSSDKDTIPTVSKGLISLSSG